jgi:uncharacterized protein with von Willebrand factor type A (vWA) domain
MRIIALLIALATVIVVVIGYEYLTKLANKNQKDENEKHKGSIDKEIEDLKNSSEKTKEIKEKINNIN